ncbi:MAG: peptidylprolyl isomerase [Pseudomonadota bacterium]
MHHTTTHRRVPAVCLLLSALLAGGIAHGKTVDTLNDPKLAMTVDARAYPVRIVDMLVAAARDSKKNAGWSAMLDGLAENQLMAKHAVREVGREKLLVADRVGFAPEILREEQLISIIRMNFRKELEAYVRSRPGGTLKDLISWQIPANDPALKELTTLRDIGEVRLTPAQRELARKTTVAILTFPDRTKRNVSFEDIYVHMNVQGRVRVLQDRELAFLDAQIKSRAEALFITWWAEARSGLSVREIALLKNLLEEKQLRESYLVRRGVMSAIHEDTPEYLLDLQKKVTKPEILAWYEKHKEEFRQVEKVKARHIRCATEAACNAAKAAIDKGMEFSAAAKKFSVAADKSGTPAGSLGWIMRETKDLPWLHQVALIQKKGQMTPPIRTPEDASGNAAWEIVLVDERVEGYSAPDSETVAYQARQEIAKKKALEAYRDLRASLLDAADIRRNGALLKARSRPEDDTSDELEAMQHADDGHGHGHGH